MTGTLVILGTIALAAGVLVGVRLRMRLDRRAAAGRPAPELGLLETVAVLSSRQEAEGLARRLCEERVRSTVAPPSTRPGAAAGWRLLVFPGQAADARELLRTS